MRSRLKAFRAFLCILGFIFHSWIGSSGIRGDLSKRRYRIMLASRYAKRFCRILGLNIQERSWAFPGASLIVSNHLSYLDAVVFSAIRPSVFVTSVEVRDSFLLGWVAKLAGCAFVERRSRLGLDREVSELVELLKEKFDVILFPEGTTSNGWTILPFKRSLYRAAVLADRPVLPAALHYTRANGARISKEALDCVAYYGDHEFPAQFSRLLSLQSLEATVQWEDPLWPAPERGIHRLCEMSEQRIHQIHSGLLCS